VEKNVTNQNINIPVTNKEKIMVSTACQTEEMNECSPNEKLCAFILECLTTLVPNIKTTVQEKEKVISDVTLKHYGKELDVSKVSYFLKENLNRPNQASALRITDSDIADNSNLSSEGTIDRQSQKSTRKKRKKQVKR